LDEQRDLTREPYNKTNNHPGSVEYGAYIYAMPDGSLGTTIPFETGGKGELTVILGRGTMPDGTRIVAWVHTHPDGGDVRQNRISHNDVQELNAIKGITPDSAAANSYGWSGDPIVLACIAEVRGLGDGDVSKYHRTDFANRPGTVLGGCYGD